MAESFAVALRVFFAAFAAPLRRTLAALLAFLPLVLFFAIPPL
jgi:hypothetical protein